MIPIGIEIDPGIGAIVEAAEKLAARRERRKNEVWAEVKDDIEAISMIVRTTDELYLGLLGRIQHAAASRNNMPNRTRAELIEEVHHFTHDQRIRGLLIELGERIAVASRQPALRLNWQKRRDAANALRSLERATDLYVKYLREIHETKVPQDASKQPLWNLASLLRYLETGESESGLSLYDHCEEVIRNRRSDILDSVHRMAGRSTGHIRRLQG